jgi:hypothetical protein
MQAATDSATRGSPQPQQRLNESMMLAFLFPAFPNKIRLFPQFLLHVVQ